MMLAALNSALAGMQAASDHLAVAAENIANAQSTGDAPGEAYHAQEAIQTSKYGAPYVVVREKQPATVETYAPDHPAADADGKVAVPNVDLGEEMVNLLRAEAAYKANIAVMKTVQKMNDALFDIFDHHHHHRHA